MYYYVCKHAKIIVFLLLNALILSPYVLQVRHICDVSSWYSLLTEVLCCGPCLKAGRSGEGGKMGRWLAWDPAIICQLSEAHQAKFPAILTSK